MHALKLLILGSMVGCLEFRLHAATEQLLVPMRDGISLSTLVERPEGAGPFPTILIRSPYEITPGSPFLEAGYAVVQQNLRGLFKSEGTWPQFAKEREDGYDAIEWIAAQPWSNGKVGVMGGSGPGIAGYFALMSGAPHLAAGVIQYAHGDPYRAASFPGGVYQSGLMDSWLKARGVEPPPPFPRPIIHRLDNEYLQQDIRTHASKVKTPILHVTGWFDVFTQGALDYYRSAVSDGADLAKENQKLIISPGGHGGLLPGDLQWQADLPDSAGLPRRWFDHWLRDTNNGVEKIPPVQFYMLGDPKMPGAPGNRWIRSSTWPPSTASDTSFYLQPEGQITRVPPTGVGSRSFDYDPNYPVGTILAKAGDWLNRPPLDQRPLASRADILRFQTAPLTEPLAIAGQLSAEIFVSTTARDTDFFVRLVDIYPDGYEALLASQPMRLRFRDGFEKMSPAGKNRVYKLQVNLWSLAIVFAKGHRIGAQITSSDSPRFDRHTNTWDPVNSYEDAVVASNTVYYSEDYPSRLILPVLPVRW